MSNEYGDHIYTYLLASIPHTNGITSTPSNPNSFFNKCNSSASKL